MKKCSYIAGFALVAVTVVAIQLTNIGNERRDELADMTSNFWWTLLVASSLSPWTIQRIYDLGISYGTLRSSKTRFTAHEMINNIAGVLYHVYPHPCFVYVAMVNFPLLFSELFQAVQRKEANMLLRQKKKQNVLDEKEHKLCEVPELASLISFSVIVYTVAALLVGKSYILSGCGVITLAFPLLRCDVSSSIAMNAVPLGILFLLENHFVIQQIESCHAMHVLGHYAIHKATNDLYVGYFEEYQLTNKVCG